MYQKMLAPLDGSELSECSLEHVREIAIACKATEVVLLMAVGPVQTLSGFEDALTATAFQDSEQRAREWAEGYLAKAADKLKSEGINAKPVVVQGIATDVILDYAKNNQTELIVMSTHGKSGTSRFFIGSTAEKVSRHSPSSLLLITPSVCRAT